MAKYHFGFDIGGTFTDFVLLDEETGSMLIGKVLTTPDDPTKAVIDGIHDLLDANCLTPAAVSGLVHATTLMTNAIIERKGARTGLLTTKGFGDTLEIRRELRYDLYDLELKMPEPFVPKCLRREVTERLDATGKVVAPLSEADILDAAKVFKASGVESVAVSFLHSYSNPVHECRAGVILHRELPEVMISLSSEICPDLREYERSSTTVLNAYVQPLTVRYLEDLCQRLASSGFTGTPFIMLSSGGVTTMAAAAKQPIRLIESGPAAGALAAAYFGTEAACDKVVAFDMGGTTAKIAVIRDGRPQVANQFEAGRVHRFKKGSGHPVKMPTIDLIEIGAGGGSIAWIDGMGLLKVGPESTGAQPGPACYGRGGTKPCVTDANLLLGYLDPCGFLGGRMRLDRAAAETAMKTIAEPLGLEVGRASWGIREVVNENMARAAQVYTAEQGMDVTEFTLISFGGAGPVHACDVARKLGVRRILCPLGAGIASAIGLLVAPKRVDSVQAFFTRLDRADFDRVNSIFGDMEQRARRTMFEAGVEDTDIELVRSAEMRYRGQGYEITVVLPHGELHAGRKDELRKSFETAYRELYGRTITEAPVEVVNWRMTALERKRAVRHPVLASMKTRDSALPKNRLVYWDDGYMNTAVYSRYDLRPGKTILGPALVEENETTTAVGPGTVLQVDDSMNLIIDIQSEKRNA